MKIRDVEVDFDFLDADNVERLEKEAEKVSKKIENEELKQMGYAETIREECNIIEKFFDGVFGEGTSEKLFKGKKNLKDHITVFDDVINAKIEKQKDLENTYKRYQPNREQRRNNKYNKGRR